MSIALGHSGRRTALAVAFGAAVLLQLPLAGPADAAAAKTSNGIACTIVGTSGANTLRGTAGKDVICGLGGNDRIYGGTGTDSFTPIAAE
jgi:Ca2+-binding RTX toxin-like protein